MSSKEAELISLPVVDENKDLQYVRDRIKELKEKYSSDTLTRDINDLKGCSRMQNISTEFRSACLKELQKRKLIKQIIEGDFFI